MNSRYGILISQCKCEVLVRWFLILSCGSCLYKWRTPAEYYFYFAAFLRYVTVVEMMTRQLTATVRPVYHTHYEEDPLFSGEVIHSINSVYNLQMILIWRSIRQSLHEGKTVFDVKLALCRLYYLISYAWSAFCSKPASANTGNLSVREPGNTVIHFYSNSPQE
jgi:hypothetical protein